MNSESTLSNALSEVDIALAARNHDRAIALANELLATNLDAAGVWRARARAFESANRPLLAAEAHGRVLDFLPADRNAVAALARMLDAAGNTNEARIWARQALDYKPLDLDLQRIASSPGEPYKPDAVAMSLRAALAQTQVGLLDRGIAGLKHVASQRPDRADVKVALAHALWKSGWRVATAELCQSILDEQPDCLDAHVILLQLWRHMAAPQQEQFHVQAIERIDPDHRLTAELLGEQTPLAVQDVPATRATGNDPVISAQEDEQSREDWVDRLVAAASSAPAPLDKIVPAFASPAPELTTTASNEFNDNEDDDQDADGDDVDIDTSDAIDMDALRPLEWSAANDYVENDKDGFDLPWLPSTSRSSPAVAPGGFVPSRPASVTPDPKDGVPERIDPLEWSELEADQTEQTGETGETGRQGDKEAATQSSGSSVSSVSPVSPVSPPPTKPAKIAKPEPKPLPDQLADANAALNSGRMDEAFALYKKAIAALRGKKLDPVITDLEAAVRVEPESKKLLDLLGLAYARKGDHEMALAAYQRAMKLEE